MITKVTAILQLWPTHKYICHPGESLVFSQRPLDLAELRHFVRAPESQTTDWPITGVVQRLNSLSHSTTTDSRAGMPRIFYADASMDGGMLNVRAQDFTVTDAVSSEINSPELWPICLPLQAIWGSYERILATTPPLGQTEIITKIRSWLYQAPESPLKDAFTCVSSLLAASTPSPTSLLASVDAASRNAFELQALVLCTLLEGKASVELLEDALERMGDLVDGNRDMLSVWRRAGVMVGDAVERGRS